MSKSNCPECSLYEGAADIALLIVRAALRVGGDMRDAMILTEFVVACVFMVAVKPSGDDEVMDALAAGIQQRLSAMRLAATKAEGRA